MKHFAITLLVIAATPLIAIGALAAWAMYNRDAQPIVFTGDE